MVNMLCIGADGSARTTRRDIAHSSSCAGRRQQHCAAAPRLSMARLALIRSTISRVVDLRKTSTGVHAEWPNGPLHSALRICNMDDTVDDWNRLVD